MKNKLKVKLTAIAIASTMTVVAPIEAKAWKIVFDPTAFIQMIVDYGVQYKHIFETIMNGLRQDAMTANIRALGDQIRTQIQQDWALAEVDDARERRLAGDKMTLEMDMMLMPTVEACAEATKAKFQAQPRVPAKGRGGQRNTEAPGQHAAGYAVATEVEYRMQNTRTSTGGAQMMMENSSDLGTCDSASPRPGCSGDGTHPGADRNAVSVYGNVDTSKALDKVTVNGQVQKKVLGIVNYSMDGKGVEIAANAVANLIGITPNNLSVEEQKKPDSLGYSSSVDTYRSRITHAQQALSNVIAMRAAMDLQGGDLQNWKGKFSTKYKEYFPNNPVPEKPSWLDYMRVVVRINNEESAKGANPQIYIATNTAITNILLTEMMQKQDLTNGLLAAQLAQSMNPIDVGALQEQYKKLSSAK